MKKSPRLATPYIAKVCFCRIWDTACPHCKQENATHRHRDACHLAEDERMKEKLND